MNLKYDIFAKSINKYDEKFCGDYYLISKKNDKTRIVLADGIGSGFTANLHASMTAKMLMSIIENGESFENALKAVISSMTSEVSGNYCAFLLFETDAEGCFKCANFNMPDPLFFHHGNFYEPKTAKKVCNKKTIKLIKSKFTSGDSVALISNGVIKAGTGTLLKHGLGKDNVTSYLEVAYKPKITSKRLTELLINVCNSLYLEKPSDDFSAVIIKAQKSISSASAAEE